MAELYLKQNMAWLHGICVPHTRGVDKGGEGPTTNVMSFPRVLKSVKSPVPWCLAVAHSTGLIWENFMYRHFWSQVAVVQEGADPLPHCDLCGMHMPEGRIIKHLQTQRCNKNTHMRWRRQEMAILRQWLEATFILMGEDGAESIEGVDVFEYLKRLMYQ